MTNPAMPWGAAQAASTYQAVTSVARIDGVRLTRERSYDRTALRFTGRGERLIAGAGYEVCGVYAVLLDARGDVVARRNCDSGRQLLLTTTCTWAHEFYDEQLAAAAAVAYEVEVRVDARRVLFTGELAAVDVDRDSRQVWACPPSAPIEDRLLRLSVGTFYNRGELEVTVMGTAACVHDGHTSDLEFNLRDRDGETVASRWSRLSIGPSTIGYADTTIRLEQRFAKVVRSLEVVARTDARTINRVGPLALTEAAAGARRAPEPPPAAEPPPPAARPPTATARPAKPARPAAKPRRRP